MQQTEPRVIAVEITLVGGQKYTTAVMSDSPFMASLLEGLALNLGPSADVTHRLLQIPLEEGRSALTFSSRQLVSIVTQPPVLADIVPTSSEHIIRPPFVQFDDFLEADELQKLLAYTVKQESEMWPGEVEGDDPNHRKSKVIVPEPDYVDGVIRRLRAELAEIIRKLGVPPFQIGDLEVWLTAHNDGDYFRPHRDQSPEGRSRTREVTFVYYFYRDPGKIRGGDLRLFDSKLRRDGSYDGAPRFQTLEPRHNRLIAFPSYCLHEVTRVSCPSKEFADSRFTVNGWFHRADQEDNEANAR